MNERELKMLRSVLDRQRDGIDAQESFGTPSRGGNVSYPRIRLMDKHSKLEEIPVYTLPSNKPTAGIPSTSRGRIRSMRPESWLPRVQLRDTGINDRFIPRRRHQNLEASNYFLTKVPPRIEEPTEIDVFGQIESLDTTWRKKLMRGALQKSHLIPEGRNQRILNIGKQEVNRENRGTTETAVDDAADGVWKTKARMKPLINLTDVVVHVPWARSHLRHGMMDWGGKNFIATATSTSLSIFEAKSQQSQSTPGRFRYDMKTQIRFLKWNHAGTKIVIGTQNADIVLLLLESEKTLWQQKCRCTIATPPVNCDVLCIAWTHTDKEIAIGCLEGRVSSYNATLGTLIDTVFVHSEMILAIAFSPTDRYLATTGLDKVVRILLWPDLVPYLSIGYYEPVQTLAWHPWEVGIMCAGGGFEDGSLSLWDIHRQTSLGYRKIQFLGVVSNMAWNKLSGELVVQWNYQSEESSARAITAVLSSLDKVVDIVSEVPRIKGIAWNPDSTKIALRVKNYVKIWNFFGNESRNWCDDKENKNGSLKRKRGESAGRKRNFEGYTIR